MNSLLIGLLGVLVATNQTLAASNLVVNATGLSISVPNPNDPVEKEYEQLLADDDAAQAEADRLIQGNNSLQQKGVSIPAYEMGVRVAQRLEPVRKKYLDFLKRHPNHARARLAFGSFLNDTGQEEEGVAQWEQAREIDPKNPAAWNNLANYYGHRGPVTNAFKYYEQAIELNPKESVYYHNFGNTVYLFRVDAMEMYHLTEKQVFDRALELLGKAIELDPENFILAQDVAQTYYGIRPPRVKEALAAWQYALKLAKDDLQREGIYIHLARNQMSVGDFASAHQNLNLVTNEVYKVLKDRLVRNLAQKEKPKPPAGTGVEGTKSVP